MRLEATTPEGVYAARDIAGEQELQAMGRQVDRAAEELEVGCGGGCRLVLLIARETR